MVGRLTIVIIVLVAVIAVGGVAFLSQSPSTVITTAISTTTTQLQSGTTTSTLSIPQWMLVTLKDPRTGQSFRIVDFQGKVVVLEIMAIWCPRCVPQADEMQRVLDTLPSDVKAKLVFISVDVDPNENEQNLARYADSFKRTWPFVYDSTGEFLKSFVRDKGTTVRSEIPTTPIYIIDPNGKLVRVGPSGVEQIKSASEIISAINSALS